MTYTPFARLARRAASALLAAGCVALLTACPSDINGRVDRINGPISGGGGGGGTTGGGTGGGGTTPPTEIRGSFVEVLAAGASSCGLTGEGKAYCWGHNKFADLGTGNRSDVWTPKAVSTDQRFTSISNRLGGGCGVTAQGAAWCWGETFLGLLNGGTTLPWQESPLRFQGTQVWKTIEFGRRHMCGIDADGAAWCWGDNSSGALGIGSYGPDSLSAPQRVVGGRTWTHIAPGDDFTCGRATDGIVYCWGLEYANASRLGSPGGSTPTPRPIATTEALADVYAGDNVACSRMADVARVMCWGFAEVAGVGLADGDVLPTRISLDQDIIDLSVGEAFSCVVTSSNRAWCWGYNQYGQLGDGTTEPRTVPVEVQSSIGFTKVDAGQDHACAVALDGTSYCWGVNGWGELGNGQGGTLNPNPIPVRVK